MGIWGDLAREGIGIGGKLLMGAADGVTGGLASKLLGSATRYTRKHAGIIGKVASGIGHKLLGDKTRKTLSNIADSAIKFIPEGDVKSALTRINNSAQGRPGNYKVKKSIPSKLKNDLTEDGGIRTKTHI